MDRPTDPQPRGPDYTLQHFSLAPNWRYVLWTGTQHVTRRIYLLGMAANTTTVDPNLIIGLGYEPSRGWIVAENEPGFCGLLPPDQDLVPFEAANPCGHTP